ncbi:MAG: hypothetical protein EOP49_46485 [Sphingobacteriales bacterium]|nr:MAG: hypothetical protein EOP49_46485 [Sphingobacteriales bacterium]
MVWASLCLLLFSACKKDGPGKPAPAAFDCLSFKTGISIEDHNMVATQISTLTADLHPSLIASDEYGQRENLQVLAERIGQQCDVAASVICYACIETYPAQSEIRVAFTLNGISYNRVLDISVDDQRMLVFAGMHE